MYNVNVANSEKNVKCRRAKKDKISALWNENKKTRREQAAVRFSRERFYFHSIMRKLWQKIARLNKGAFFAIIRSMIWVIGSTGMLGAELCRLLEKNKIQFVGTSSAVDARDFTALKAFADKWERDNYVSAHKNGEPGRIQWIVNCSAYTAVEKAESDKEAAQALNVDAARNIARTAREIGAKLIHISTDYVFDGKASAPYTESGAKSPLGVYGKTKSDGEDEIQKTMNQYFIIRTSWLYGYGRPNFVYTMAKLMNSKEEIKVVNDQRGSPTFTADLAEAILDIIKTCGKAGTNIFSKETVPYGIYHYTDSGDTTWFDFAVEIQRLLKKRKLLSNDCRVLPCTTAEFGAKVERPAYSVLSKEKIKAALKIKIPKWQDSLERFIKDARFEMPQ